MKYNYQNPIAEIIVLGCDEIRTLLTESVDGENDRPLDFDDIINGAHNRQ